MQSTKPQTFLGWSAVVISTILIILSSSLIVYPQITDENILTALRFTSLTTAIPFLIFFIAKPFVVIKNELGQWLKNNHLYLWLILTISHLTHLYQIFLYYQLGEICPLSVWLVTSPLWIIMVIFSVLELIKPQLSDSLYQESTPRLLSILHNISIWYIWFVFTIAFALGTIGKHLLFYNIPALILFLAGAIFPRIVGWRRKIVP